MAPMTKVIKGTSFVRTPKAQSTFEEIKTRLTQAPTLSLPYFSKVFEVESDGSRVGIGGVLTQEGKPLADADPSMPFDLKKANQLGNFILLPRG